MNIQFKKGEAAFFINNKRIEMPASITNIFEFENVVVVTLDFDWDLQNVFCYDEEGNQLWRIEKPGFFTAGTQGYDFVTMDSGLDERYYIKGRILAFNRGRPFELDIKTGKVTTIPGKFEK
ncbi:MAG: hypothetical protein ACKOX6_12750 [Bdellovibrio sp.]